MQPRAIALLTYLTVARPRGFHRRDLVAAMFWPELSHDASLDALHREVDRMRQDIGVGVIASRGPDELCVDPNMLWCDVTEFERALERGDTAKAIELYRGDLLSGFVLGEAVGFEQWLHEERTRLRALGAQAFNSINECARHPFEVFEQPAVEDFDVSSSSRPASGGGRFQEVKTVASSARRDSPSSYTRYLFPGAQPKTRHHTMAHQPGPVLVVDAPREKPWTRWRNWGANAVAAVARIWHPRRRRRKRRHTH